MNTQEYIEVVFKINPFSEENAEILMAELQDLPFESFITENPVLRAFVPKESYSQDMVKLAVDSLPFDGVEVSFSASLIPPRNWNAVWEEQFSPIVVDGLCTIKATFHKGLGRTRFNVTIDPKMAFGTGHHQTTFMMCRALMSEESFVKGKSVMDMGCGTGILAILAAKMGASPVHGIDIDAVAALSALENARLNRVSSKVDIRCGDASLLQASSYDVLLANINRNILLGDIPTYARSVRRGGLLVVSGFYHEDMQMIVTAAENSGFSYISHDLTDNWCCVKFRRI